MAVQRRKASSCWLISWTVFLAGGAAAADIRLGVVNPVKVMEASPQYEDASKLLEKEFASRERKLSDAQKRLKQLEERLTKDGAVMSEPERRNLEKDLHAGQRELRRDQDEAREDFTIRRNEELRKIQKQMVEAIQAIAKEDGYDVIVGEGVMFASDKVDVTQKVLERLKKGHKVK